MESCNKESEVSANTSDNESIINSSLSKRQLKKIKKREKWLTSKPEKRLKERIKLKEKRAFAKAHNIDLGPSRKFLKSCKMADSSCKLNVAIDLSFDDKMLSKELGKLTKQILRCYTLNRRAVAPLQFSLTSFQGKCKEEMSKHIGYNHWDVNFLSESYLNIFPKEKIVYLSSESENIIEELDYSCIYIIGGLVDHNREKGLCHRLAIENEVKHGRLPIDKFLKMKARKVLTIDHVFEIILRVTENNDWQNAFLKVLPERKKAIPIEQHSFEIVNSEKSLDTKSNQTEK